MLKMTKKENVDEIIYDLKMKGSADFEVDEVESFSVDTLTTGGFCFTSQSRYFEVLNLTAARKEINKLGKNILHM
jgi:hypothetical protein